MHGDYANKIVSIQLLIVESKAGALSKGRRIGMSNLLIFVQSALFFRIILVP
jgi:hypothetical protein